MPLLFGTQPTGMVQAPQLVHSETEAMAEQLLVDPSLPIIGRDPQVVPNNDFIVIARGRIVGIKNPQTASLPAFANTGTDGINGKSFLTLANGSEGLFSGTVKTDVRGLGFAEQNIFRSYPGQVQQFPKILRDKIISIPYIQTSNGAYGDIIPGDHLTAYYGTSNASGQIAQEIGKVVKWVPKAMYSNSQAASTVAQLTSAVYPAFKPRVIMAFNAGAVVSVSSVTYTYAVNGGGANWKATFSTAVTDVIYEYGQNADNRVGICTTLEAVGTANGNLTAPHAIPGWLDWVRDNFGAWALPPIQLQHTYTNVTDTGLTALGNNVFQLSHYPVVSRMPITVTVTGTRTDPNSGVASPLTNSVLPIANPLYFQDFTYGADYTINPVTGQLTISSDILVTNVDVSYSADQSYLDGKIYNPGVMGLTDGRYSGQAGTPANLELLGVCADMHCLIF